jgi:anion-transporting  ArsA/GET3 family ATPase
VLADVLSGKRIVICAGPGGVGKTTTSAAVAAGLAERGQRVAVLTIDPARRLADALGLDVLDDTPRAVNANLSALMLDSKRTFDALIDRVAPSDEARDEVLANPIYRQLSSAVAGTQEFTAIAKLYDLDAAGEFDVLVLDTPPSRNALDFLDAPDRLTGFLQGRAIRWFLRPGRLLGAGTGVVFGALRRATGVALLDDLSTFFRALGSMIGDLAERGAHVKALLNSPTTVFLLVTSLEREPVDETIFFYERLRDARMPFGAVVVNKLREPVADAGPLDLPGPVARRARRPGRHRRPPAPG